MALQYRKRMTLEGESVVDGVAIQGYRAELSETDPENSLVMNDWIIDKAAYKANRSQARTDSAAFEDAVFALQDELIADLPEETEEA